MLAGLLLSNNQRQSPLADGVDAVAVPVTVSTVRVPTPRPAPQGVPTVVQQPAVQPPAPTIGQQQQPITTPPPATVQPRAQTYTVVAGDTLTFIASRLNVDVQELIDLNEITDPGALDVGQVLQIP